MGVKTGTTVWGNCLAASTKAEVTHTIQPSNSAPSIDPGAWICLPSDVLNIYSSFIHSIPKPETIQRPINSRMINCNVHTMRYYTAMRIEQIATI